MHVLTMADLHQRFDGPIPRGEVAAAEREAAGTSTTRAAARTTGRPSIKPHITLGLMAGVMVDLIRDRGEVTERDLLRHGFTVDQVRTYGERAKAMAAPRLPADRQVA
jgi:hypothetical protein